MKSSRKEEKTPCSPCTNPVGQILFHITRICLPKWGEGNFCKHSAYQSSHSHTGPIKNERTTQKAPKHILHFITIKAESGGTASAFRLIQELYFFVYPCHDSATNKTPSAPDHFPPVGRGSVIQLINESVQQSCVSPQSVSGLPEVRMSRRSSCGFSQKVNRVDCHRQNYCVVQCYGKLTSHFGRRIMTLLGCS